MKELEDYTRGRIRELIKLMINRSIQEKKINSEFRRTVLEKFEDLERNLIARASEIKSKEDLLSPKEIERELKISRKTFDRWINGGLKKLQNSPGASIRVRREDLENYLNDREDVRLN